MKVKVFTGSPDIVEAEMFSFIQSIEGFQLHSSNMTGTTSDIVVIIFYQGEEAEAAPKKGKK